MTDITPVPLPPTAVGPETLSVDQVLAIERQLRENKAAELRGEPAPHQVTPDQMRACLMAIRKSRGTLDLASKASGGSKKGGSSAARIELDLGELDL